MKAQTITRSALVQAIEARKGAEAIRIYAETDARLLKTGNPHKDAKKQSIISALLGTRYKENIEKLTGKTFDVSPRQWGVTRPSGKIVEHKGKFYLIVRTTEAARKATKKFVQYIDGGEKIPFEEVAPFLPTKAPSAKQELAGLSEQRQVRETDFSIENIRAVKMRGSLLTVIPDKEEKAKEKIPTQDHFDRAYDLREKNLQPK